MKVSWWQSSVESRRSNVRESGGEKSDAILNVASIIIIFKLELERWRTSNTKHIAKRGGGGEAAAEKPNRNNRQIIIIERDGGRKMSVKSGKISIFSNEKRCEWESRDRRLKNNRLLWSIMLRSLACCFLVFASRSEKWSFSGRWQKVNELAANRLVEFSPSHHCRPRSWSVEGINFNDRDDAEPKKTTTTMKTKSRRAIVKCENE